jgi:polysaccharide biosynthesis protein PslH
MKILQLSHKMPFPLHDGGACSICNTAVGLMNGGMDVKVFAISTSRRKVDQKEVPAEYSARTRFSCCEVDTRVKPHAALLNLLSRESYFVARFWSEEWNEALVNILHEEKFDVIQLEHVYLCLYLETIREHSTAKIILRPQNVENQVWSRCIACEKNPLKRQYLRIATNRLRRFEMNAAAKVDGIIAISDADAAVFRAYAPGINVISVPLGFDFSRIMNCDLRQEYDDFPVFYHLGSMDWMPNIQGMRWFIDEVVPYIRKEYPGFRFRMAGKSMPQWFLERQDENIIVDRMVSDSLDYQRDKSIMVVPLLSGGGLRAKIIEGMALGKTIISTSVGAEGIPFTDGEDLLIANTKEEFAMQVAKCRDSREMCMKIGENARILALEYFDCNALAGKMIAFYDEIAGNRDIPEDI